MKKIISIVILLVLNISFLGASAEIPFNGKIEAQRKRVNSRTAIYDQSIEGLKDELDKEKDPFERANLREDISRLRPLKSFWDQEKVTVTYLRRGLTNNPAIFDGKEAKRERFRIALDAKHDYQSSMDDLLNQGTYTNEEVAELRETLIKNNLYLLITARAGKPNKVQEATGDFALNLNKIRTAIDVYNLELGLKRSELELELDPAKIEELKAQILVLREQRDFWEEEIVATDRIKRFLVINSNVVINKKQNKQFLKLITRKTKLQNDTDEAISLGKKKLTETLKGRLNTVNQRLQAMFTL